MNILQINTIDNRGGAAKMATRLRQGLQDLGQTSPMIVAHKTEQASDAYELPIHDRLQKRNKKLNLAGMIYPTYKDLLASGLLEPADVINLHNIHQMPDGYFNIRDLPKITSAKPTVWTLHDPWIVYEYGAVPEYDPLFKKESRLFLRQKRKAIERANLTITVPSQWLHDLVRKYYPDKPIKLLRYGVDTDVFSPINKQTARKKLSISADASVVLFVANEGEDNGPKGTIFLNQAKQHLEKAGVTFISLGSSQNNTYISSEAEMANYYAAADVFALPSLAENSPITILEALSCGTPVVAFDIGGISGSIEHLKNGYLAKYKDGADFTNGLKKILEDKQLHQRMSKQARAKATKYFSLYTMVENYLKLYKEVL